MLQGTLDEAKPYLDHNNQSDLISVLCLRRKMSNTFILSSFKLMVCCSCHKYFLCVASNLLNSIATLPYSPHIQHIFSKGHYIQRTAKFVLVLEVALARTKLVLTRTFRSSRETQAQHSSLFLTNHAHFRFLINHTIVLGHPQEKGSAQTSYKLQELPNQRSKSTSRAVLAEYVMAYASCSSHLVGIAK